MARRFPDTQAGRALAVRRRLGHLLRRRSPLSDGLALVGLSVLSAVVGVFSRAFGDWVPLSMLALVLLAGSALLRTRSLLLLYAVVTAVVLYVIDRRGGQYDVRPGTVVVLAGTALAALYLAHGRSRLGVQGFRGEAMLFDLRERLRAQGEMPALPPGWGAEVVVCSAYGGSFGGDFLVASRSPDGKQLEVVLVDVSGKGTSAGTRALLLSGAFGGLLGALPSEQFLGAANAYLLRQTWNEGFATAIHLVVDLETGDYTVSSAGHLPPAQFHAGSGRWRLEEASAGPLLGVLPDVRYDGSTGRLDPGDALLLYTDGLVEVPGRDLAVGIDRLLGQAERLVTKGFEAGAGRLVDAVGNGDSDDRALALVWRR